MKSLLLLLPALVLMAFSCETTEETGLTNTCSVTNPARDLPWLREQIQVLERQDSSVVTIYQAEYKGETVFIFDTCCINCNTVVPVYNCKGEIICSNAGSPDCVDFTDTIRNKLVIGKAKKQVCSL
jgi:hypothetical protein